VKLIMLMLVFHSEVLLDHHALGGTMPAALASVMAARHGQDAGAWQDAYLKIVADWDSYWADLSLDGQDSLAQWREGRWRIIRALFRLMHMPEPPLDAITLYLDEIPYEIGQRCEGWKPRPVEALKELARQGFGLSILAAYQPAALIRGLLDQVHLGEPICRAFGPDEIGQFGLEGIGWEYIAGMTGCDPSCCVYIGAEPPWGARAVKPPADLSSLPGLLREKEWLTDD
jgi:hypothetical protein